MQGTAECVCFVYDGSDLSVCIACVNFTLHAMAVISQSFVHIHLDIVESFEEVDGPLSDSSEIYELDCNIVTIINSNSQLLIITIARH